MFQPKQFYRDLETLLHEPGPGTLSRAWFRWLMREIVTRFGEALLIDSGRLYEAQGPGYAIDYGVGTQDLGAVGLEIPLAYRPLQLVLEHGVYVFDTTVEGQSEELERKLGGLESAAITMQSIPRRIMAFGLRPGWQRDDLDFALNTIRNSIDLRITVQGLQTDIMQAAEIQQSLLPRTPPEMPGFTIAARSQPAEQVGGDFYDFIGSEGGTTVVALGDASGHGLGAALLARDSVTGIRMGAERSLKITEIIHRLNRVIARSALSSRFVSLFYADLEPDGDIFYVNAGHPPPWLAGPDGVSRLEVGGTILGPVKAQTFRRGFAHMNPGDTLVIVSDGLTERTDSLGVMFGEEGIEALATRHRGEPAERVLDAIFTASFRHGGEHPWEDDTTAVVVTRNPEG